MSHHPRAPYLNEKRLKKLLKAPVTATQCSHTVRIGLTDLTYRCIKSDSHEGCHQIAISGIALRQFVEGRNKR